MRWGNNLKTDDLVIDLLIRKANLIVQELVNHDAVINKIYNVGSYSEIQIKVSIPNIT